MYPTMALPIYLFFGCIIMCIAGGFLFIFSDTVPFCYPGESILMKLATGVIFFAIAALFIKKAVKDWPWIKENFTGNIPEEKNDVEAAEREIIKSHKLFSIWRLTLGAAFVIVLMGILYGISRSIR